MASESTSLIAGFEELIRQGHTGRVREALARLKSSDVTRPDLALLANIARRVGRADLALRLLHPVIRPKTPLREPASSRELAIYASALARIGAPEEAIQILEGLDDTSPDVHLYLSFAHIHQWNYADASVSLRKYIKCEGITDYEAVIGKLNLAAAYQFTGKKDEKWVLLHEILDATKKNNWVRLRSSALELAGQAAISNEDWESARKYLDEARASLPPSDSDLSIRKWEMILELKRVGARPEMLDRIRALRSEAANSRRWEAVRECDFHLASKTRDEALAEHVYFGTRHGPYRKFIKDSFREWTRMPERYVWKLGGEGATRSFDLLTRAEVDGESSLITLKTLSRFLQILASDFYAPASLGSLFAQLYRGEYFDAVHSIARVRRVIERLRIWLSENRVPLEVRIEEGMVRLAARDPYDLIVFESQSTEAARKQSLQELSVLKTAFPYKAFSVGEASQRLELSPKKVRALLQWARTEGKVHCGGKGRATRYRFEK